MEETKKSEQSGMDRRQAIQRIGIGGSVVVGLAALPTKWTKPVVDMVVIPAHAQTSPPTGSEDFAFTSGAQYFTVPAGVTAITVTAVGGEGGGGGSGRLPATPDPIGGTGSVGRTVTQSITVTPGEQLRVVVAGGGGPGSNANYFCQSGCFAGPGGYGNGVDGVLGGDSGNLGGSGGGSGGTSTVYRGTTALVSAQGGTGGGGGTSRFNASSPGQDGSAGGTGGYIDSSYQGGAGGSGYNGPNGAGTGGIYGPPRVAPQPGAAGSVVISF